MTEIRKRVYFAHPVTDYGTALEAQIVAMLGEAFDVVNPNAPEHAEGYASSGMPYFIELAGKCHTCAFLRMPSGGIGAGVGKEIGSFLVKGETVFEVTRRGEVLPPIVMTVPETRAEIADLRAVLEPTRTVKELIS